MNCWYQRIPDWNISTFMRADKATKLCVGRQSPRSMHTYEASATTKIFWIEIEPSGYFSEFQQAIKKFHHTSRRIHDKEAKIQCLVTVACNRKSLSSTFLHTLWENSLPPQQWLASWGWRNIKHFYIVFNAQRSGYESTFRAQSCSSHYGLNNPREPDKWWRKGSFSYDAEVWDESIKYNYGHYKPPKIFQIKFQRPFHDMLHVRELQSKHRENLMTLGSFFASAQLFDALTKENMHGQI